MILTTHAIVGAAIGRLVLNPYEAFALGFISHFLIDAIPHCAYPLASLINNEKNPLKKDMVLDLRFAKDLVFIAIDFCVGIALAIFIFQGVTDFTNFSLPLLAGVFGGVLPDALQFAYFKIRHEPLTTLQKFHYNVNGEKDILGLPYGILSQILVIIAAIMISKFIL